VAGLRVVVEFSLDQLAVGEEGAGVGLQFCLRDVEKGVKWTGVTGAVQLYIYIVLLLFITFVVEAIAVPPWFGCSGFEVLIAAPDLASARNLLTS